ncbi:MAG TPA: glycosyltransferase family 4 protein [candidate division Zixibacteria bacterium]|jgi:glycosyltransferase involved in cell wall biosynthesis
MRIIVSATLGGFSAGTWYAVNTARRLVSRGHEVLYIPRPAGESARRAESAGLRVTSDIDLEKKSPRRAYRNLRTLLNLMTSFGPDVVLAHGSGDHSFWGLARLIGDRRMALIRVRALDPKPPRRHALARWLHHKATDAVVTANTRHYAYYRSALAIPAERMRIIGGGIDPEEYRDTGDDAFRSNEISLPDGRRIVVLLARFAPVKGHRVLLTAASRIRERHSDTHFLFVGRAAAYNGDQLRRWTFEMNLQGAVTIVDRPLPSIPALLARCAIGVVASVGSETVSRALLEYLASGLAVVATDVGGVPDLLSRGEFGRLIPPDNSTAIAAAVSDLLDNDERRRRMGAAARAYVLGNCTWDQRVDEWERLLYETIARVRGRDIAPLNDGEPPGGCQESPPAVVLDGPVR